MAAEPENHDVVEPPDIASWLVSFLSVREDEYEEQYAPAANEEEEELHAALNRLRWRAADLVTTGVLPSGFADELGAYESGSRVESKVRELLSYRIVHHRLEFAIAERVCNRLEGLDRRVQVTTILTIVLLGYTPSQTAQKYFERATTLYLAGYSEEAILMCGAVLEAALRARFPDELLEADGVKARFPGDYSVKQRLGYERRHPIFTDGEREAAADVWNWRNDIVHVQPDIVRSPEEALVSLTVVLAKVFRGDSALGQS